MATQIILLERVEKLGEMGDVVSVKPGYARNYLFPHKKAMRASKDNIAYFEAQKKVLAGENEKKRKEAEKQAKTIEGLKVPVIRQASEAGQLFGSVTSRDIATTLSEQSKQAIDKSMVVVNQAFKTIGLFDVDVALHPEVKVSVTVNIARTPEEAKIQADTGRALIADAADVVEEAAEEADVDQEAIEAEVEAQLAEVLEDDALEAEKEKQTTAAAKEAEDAAKEQARAEERAAKKLAEEEAAATAEAEAAENAEEAPAEGESEDKAE